MFTGIIEQCGVVTANINNKIGQRLIIQSSFNEVQYGESIAVNGVCLTLLTDSRGELQFDVSPETLACTTLGELKVGESVHLEKAMSASTRFGGHYVSGHVDTMASIKNIIPEGEYVRIIVGDFSSNDMRFLMPKGSIALNGVSLTINAVAQDTIEIMLVPYTRSHTTFAQLKTNDRLNVEFDYLTRIVAHQLTLLSKNLLNGSCQFNKDIQAQKV